MYKRKLNEGLFEPKFSFEPVLKKFIIKLSLT